MWNYHIPLGIHFLSFLSSCRLYRKDVIRISSFSLSTDIIFQSLRTLLLGGIFGSYVLWRIVLWKIPNMIKKHHSCKYYELFTALQWMSTLIAFNFPIFTRSTVFLLKEHSKQCNNSNFADFPKFSVQWNLNLILIYFFRRNIGLNSQILM